MKQRLIGAAVLAALAIIFLPMLLKGPDVREPDAAQVPLTMPSAPGDAFETRELPLTAPEAASPAEGVLGMKPTPATPAAGVVQAAPPADTAAELEPAVPDTATAVPPTPAATKPEPAVPAPAAGPEVAAGNHALTVGTFGNAASAAALVARLRAAGLSVQSQRVSLASGDATRVRVGPYGSRAAAEAARQRVEQISGAPAKSIVLDAGPQAPTAKPSAPSTASSPPPPGKAAAPAATQAAGSGFAVQLSAPSVEADANALRDRARGAGFAAFVQRVDTATGARFRVRLGPVADRAAAEALQADSRSKLGMGGIVVASP